jgi:hypothetical protein
MVSDALALARSQVEATFRIGGYDFRSPDYRQILLWAEALKIAPTAIVQRLAGASLKLAAGHGEPISFKVENGGILSAVWDLDSLPLASFQWVAGLSIHEFAFKGSPENSDGEALNPTSIFASVKRSLAYPHTTQFDGVVPCPPPVGLANSNYG